MPVEIERKFLVASAAWRDDVAEAVPMVQGYFAPGVESPTLRVRIAGDRGFLTVKGRCDGVSRSEFEYEIPLADAREMLEEFCAGRIVRKVRHLVPGPDGARWEVDEFADANSGLVVAEIELPAEDAPFAAPEWLGAEVSADRRYTNRALSSTPFSEWKSDPA